MPVNRKNLPRHLVERCGPRDAYEREFILKKIEESRNNVSRAAELLGLERGHLYRKMKALGISIRE
jgi:two-component system nitrogen regulation response regulator NtrX